MIQDIAPKTYNNKFKTKSPNKNSNIIVCLHNKVLVKYDENNQIIFPNLQDLKKSSLKYTYVFCIDKDEYFIAEWTSTEHVIPEGFAFVSTRTFRTAQPQDKAFGGITGYSLWLWYHTHRFCGHCGAETEKVPTERKVVCPSCKQRFYPTINPAVIVGIINNGKILMSKYNGRINKRYALIAGFAEPGETIEETVHREVMEEVGLKIKNLTFYKSQPWAFSNSLLMGFWAELDGSDKIKLDKNELSQAGWYSPEEVPEDEEHIAITQEMMTMFKEGKAPF